MFPQTANPLQGSGKRMMVQSAGYSGKRGQDENASAAVYTGGFWIMGGRLRRRPFRGRLRQTAGMEQESRAAPH
ncbi:MAG TPA: hypothetical protein PKW71_09500, partial [Anaerohalosphaeraceae bacterium]|nr:hypothetical protein [Anaerohalosphaeraceae bacterium]